MRVVLRACGWNKPCNWPPPSGFPAPLRLGGAGEGGGGAPIPSEPPPPHTHTTVTQGLEYFRSVLCVIEIARDDTVENVYFRKPTVCNMLSPHAKEVVMATVSRQSPMSKLIDFFNMAEQLILKMEYQAEYKAWLMAQVIWRASPLQSQDQGHCVSAQSGVSEVWNRVRRQGGGVRNFSQFPAISQFFAIAFGLPTLCACECPLPLQLLQNDNLFGLVLGHIVNFGGTRRLFDTRKSSRTWSVPTVSYCSAVLNGFYGGLCRSVAS